MLEAPDKPAKRCQSPSPRMFWLLLLRLRRAPVKVHMPEVGLDQDQSASCHILPCFWQASKQHVTQRTYVHR